MKEVLLKDQHMDTLLYTPNLFATLKLLSPTKKKLNLSNLRFENATIRISIDTSGVNNLKFIIDALKKPPDSTLVEKWAVGFNAIELENSCFILDNKFSPIDVSYGIDFSDVRAGNMDLKIKNFRISDDTVRFTINQLSFMEKSGFLVDHLEASVYLYNDFFLWKDVLLRTPNSELRANRLDFHFNNWLDFANNDFQSKVKLWFRFAPSTIHFSDAAYFSPLFRGADKSLNISGDLRGRISSLKGDDIVLEYSQNSRFSGSFDLIGLPDFQETYMYFDIKELTSNIREIESLQKPGAPEDTVKLSENLRQLGNISYHGIYAGFYNDFVTYGSLTTDLGNISSDLSIKPDSNENVHFRGDLSTEGFDLGRLADIEETAGKLSMNGNVEGVSFHGGGLSFKMDGDISLLEFNGYSYRNMYLAADLTNRKFDGSFSIADPNLKMEFFGKIDFTDTLPVFDFTANVDKAMLHPLNISSTDPSYTLSCYLRANFVGANLNDFDGEINLVNSLFQKQDNQIQIYDFTLFARHRPDTNRMTLSSDLVDAEIIGKYEFEDIGIATGKILAHHLPSFRNIVHETGKSDESLNNFTYSFHFKNTFPITNFFYPDVEIARNSIISGSYFPAQHEFRLDADFPDLRWKGYSYVGLKLNLISDDSIARIQTSSEVFNAGSRIQMENLRTEASAFRDKFLYSIDWDNHKPDELYRGAISGQAALQYSQQYVLPRIDLQLNAGEVVLGDSVWHISPSHVTIDTSSFSFENFSVSHRKQALDIAGIISKNPDDELQISFRELDLALISEAYEGLDFSGILRGSSTISGVYNNLLFISDLSIDSLSINNENLGNTFIRTNWISPEEKIHVNMKAMRGMLKTLDIEGEYFPKEKSIDFNVLLDKMKLNIFQPYLAKQFSNLEGISSGNIHFSGTLDKPVMNGEVMLQKTSFFLDYLQTGYSFSDRVDIRNNKFIIINTEVFDEKGSRALLNGSIETNYLKDITFDLNLLAENFIVLNTRETHNQLYYGNAVASGRIGFSGTPGEMQLQISARSERGTHMFIPINQEQDIQENNFITFIKVDQEKVPDKAEEKYSVDLGGFVLDFNLEITEDAITEIIFDPKVGDIMTANGIGNIQLSLDPQNGFQMFGDYTIESGDYLFTLQNIINKRLKIQRGGTISWNGDPTTALIDMHAIYNAKAAPGALLPDPPEYMKKRMPVDCHLVMKGNLLSPIISFDIILPTAEEETRNVVRNAITTDEELTKQFLSLIVINNFSSVASAAGGYTGSAGAGMAGVTASELLSNQLSNWLSQISNDFDIGVNYRPGDEISSDQVEVALSTQIFDDRVSIHTNVDVTPNGNATTAGQNTSAIAGDFDVEVKLTDNGRLRLKAYNRYNHDQLYKTSDYTQGVGFVYREDFNSFGELGQRYSDAITGKNRKKNKKAEDPETISSPSTEPE